MSTAPGPRPPQYASRQLSPEGEPVPGQLLAGEARPSAPVVARSAGGRPSLGASGPGGVSPLLGVRLPPALREEALAVAARQGRSLSALAREAIEDYLRAHRAP